MKQSFPIFGTVALGLAALALGLTLLTFVAGPFAPQQSVGVSVGSLAADIKQAAVAKLKGAPTAPAVARPWDIDRWLDLTVVVSAVLSLVLVVVGAVQREAPRLLVGAAVIGGSAVLFQFFIVLAFGMIGAFLIWAIMQSLPDIFTS